MATPWKPRRDMGECPTCHGRLTMYYRPLCPICEPPKLEPVRPRKQPVVTLNLIEALTHLSAKLNDQDYYDRMWNWFVAEFMFSNNSSFEFYPPETDEEEDFDEQAWADVHLFVNTFDIPADGVFLEVSW